MKRMLAILAAVLMVSMVYAYVPENDEENTFDAKVVTPFFDTTELVADGIKAIRQEVVSSEYGSKRDSSLSGRVLSETESGKEEVTSKEILYYEPKEEIYEAREVMDEVLIWLTMFRTTAGDDVVTYKKLKQYVNDKSALLDKLIDALKNQKDNKDSVMQAKLKIEKTDKDFKRYMKRLKGKVVLIEGKPLPEPK